MLLVLHLVFLRKRRTQTESNGNRELRRIFRPDREGGRAKHRMCINAELNNLGSPSYIIRMSNSRRTWCVRHVEHMLEIINTCNILVWRPERNTSFESSQCKQEKTIINLKEKGCGDVNLIHLFWDTVQFLAPVNNCAAIAWGILSHFVSSPMKDIGNYLFELKGSWER